MDDSRRRFLFGAFGVGAFTLASSVLSQAKDAPPPPAPAAPETKPPEISDEARALHSVLVARWGKDLNEQQKQGLLEAIENNVQSGQALRARTLYNGQEPATVFMISPPGPR
jgi:hypothetical protein